jgi:hypothetical protein
MDVMIGVDEFGYHESGECIPMSLVRMSVKSKQLLKQYPTQISVEGRSWEGRTIALSSGIQTTASEYGDGMPARPSPGPCSSS